MLYKYNIVCLCLTLYSSLGLAEDAPPAARRDARVDAQTTRGRGGRQIQVNLVIYYII